MPFILAIWSLHCDHCCLEVASLDMKAHLLSFQEKVLCYNIKRNICLKMQRSSSTNWMTQSNMIFVYSVANQRNQPFQSENPLRGPSAKICRDLCFTVLYILINSFTEYCLAYMVVITHIFRKLLLLLKIRKCITGEDIAEKVLTFDQEEGKEWDALCTESWSTSSVRVYQVCSSPQMQRST